MLRHRAVDGSAECLNQRAAHSAQRYAATHVVWLMKILRLFKQDVQESRQNRAGQQRRRPGDAVDPEDDLIQMARGEGR